MQNVYTKPLKEYADLSASETVVDLYCGTGAIAIYISGAAKTVIGIEIAETAVNDAMNNSRINGISNCQFILGDIKEKLAELTDRTGCDDHRSAEGRNAQGCGSQNY